MMPRHFCAHFDHNYIPRALVMLESLHAHCPGAVVHVLCLTPECFTAMEGLAIPYTRIYALSELEQTDPQCAATRGTRSLVEYYFTLTPCWPRFLLHRHELPEVTYLDADMMFFSSPEPIFTEAGEAEVIITPHRFSSRLASLEEYGRYNVSWLTFRRGEHGDRCLEWYRNACLEWCFDRIEGERYADQKYLDAFPRLFGAVHSIEHAGAGLAPWNLDRYPLVMKDGELLVQDVPLIFYHAQAFCTICGPFYSSGCRTYKTVLTREMKEYIFKPYVRALKASAVKAKSYAVTAGKAGMRIQQHDGFRAMYKRIRKEYKSSSLVIHF
ncbi:glycosyl transferase [Desulfovibrio sp. OttesenSCG-928-I05]|nr:glycosyl transferase [Desulfovibrio sp. OttesenSCG-928-I05]